MRDDHGQLDGKIESNGHGYSSDNRIDPRTHKKELEITN